MSLVATHSVMDALDTTLNDQVINAAKFSKILSGFPSETKVLDGETAYPTNNCLVDRNVENRFSNQRDILHSSVVHPT